jgi:undecaprenyl diphosphate synthase
MQPMQINRLPRHIAIIMDGNGRWAQKKLLNRIMGHEEGANSVREVVRCCRKLGIAHLTLYSFSKENWQRPDAEVKGLWSLLKRFMKSELAELIDKEIRLLHVGDSDGIPEDVLEELHRTMERTASFDKLIVSLALNYGGRQEITRAARRFAADVLAEKVSVDDLDPELFSSYLFTDGIPDPDLVIRTGGEHRISNFLLWQLAYAELYVTDTLWPDFREGDLMEALRDYQGRERRFGKTSEQIHEHEPLTAEARR